MANGDTVIKLVRRTDRDCELAHLGLAGVTQLRGAQSGGGDLHHGDVGLPIHPKHFTVVFCAVAKDNFHLVGVFDHVAVGENDAILAVHKTGALPVKDRLAGARPGRRLLLLPLLPLEIVAKFLRQLVKKRAAPERVAEKPLRPRLARHSHDHDRLGNRLGHLDECLIELLRQLEGLRRLRRPAGRLGQHAAQQAGAQNHHCYFLHVSFVNCLRNCRRTSMRLNPKCSKKSK